MDLGFDYHVYELTVKSAAADTFLEIALNGTCYDAARPGVEPNVTPPVQLPNWITNDTVRA